MLRPQRMDWVGGSLCRFGKGPDRGELLGLVSMLCLLELRSPAFHE